MNIRAVDIEGVAQLMENELDQGNKWIVYQPGLSFADFNSTVSFRWEDDASIFCSVNENDVFEFGRFEIEPLLKILRPLITNNRGRDDVAYYQIEEAEMKVSIALKTDTDLDPLFHERNPFVAKKNPASHLDRKVADEFDVLRDQLQRQGYDPDFFLTLEASMKKGVPKHEERTFDEYGGEMITYCHLFTKNIDHQYSLDRITGTLYFHSDIDHATIKGINTQILDDEMSMLNWDFDGHRFLHQNEPIFQQLCEDPIGRVIAVQLFNNHAAPFWYDKPDFLSRVEEDLKIYPKMDFPGNTTAFEVYEGLKAYQKIAAAISSLSIPETRDTNRKTAIIEQLIKGEPFSVFASSGPRQGEEVVTINCDTQSKKLSFIFKDQDIGEYIYKKHSPEYEFIRTELEQYPFRQSANDSKRQVLIEELMDGHKKPVHLEKQIVPAEHIDKYTVIERQYPDENGKYQKPVEMFSYPQAEIAILEMKKLAECFVLDENKSNSALMLVGQYKGTALQFDKEEMPTINTGFLVETITNISSDGYYPCIVGNIDRVNLLVDQIFVQRDTATNELIFSNTHGETIEIDRGFWTPNIKPSLDKNQSEGKSDLLPKLKDNGGKGLSR